MSNTVPTLTTDRLILRPFQLSDAKRVQELAGHPAVAATTATIPHPYPDGAAEEWIGKHAEWFRNGLAVQFAIVLRDSNELVGCIDLFGVSEKHRKAEMGYWIGVEHWNKGYCSEAARSLIKFGFEHFKINKVTSRHMSSNPASGRVMKKAGLQREGVLRQEFVKDGRTVDVEVYGILREEWDSKQTSR